MPKQTSRTYIRVFSPCVRVVTSLYAALLTNAVPLQTHTSSVSVALAVVKNSRITVNFDLEEHWCTYQMTDK
jgi:hypothetical protein